MTPERMCFKFDRYVKVRGEGGTMQVQWHKKIYTKDTWGKSGELSTELYIYSVWVIRQDRNSFQWCLRNEHVSEKESLNTRLRLGQKEMAGPGRQSSHIL